MKPEDKEFLQANFPPQVGDIDPKTWQENVEAMQEVRVKLERGETVTVEDIETIKNSKKKPK